MSATRRRFLLSSCSFPLLSGCAGFTESAPRVVKLEIVMANGQDELLTFRFALESPDDIGDWSAYEVEPGERRVETIVPKESRSVVGIRASVAEHEVSAELLAGNSDKICPRVVIEFELSARPTILQSTDIDC